MHTDFFLYICVICVYLCPILERVAMKVQSKNFIPAARIAINDVDLQTAVATGTDSAFTKRQAAMYAVSQEHGQTLRQQAAAIKRYALNNLPELLEQVFLTKGRLLILKKHATGRGAQ